MNTKTFFILLITTLNIQFTTQALSCSELQASVSYIRASSSRLEAFLKTLKDLIKSDKSLKSVIDTELLQSNLKTYKNASSTNSLDQNDCNNISNSGTTIYDNLKTWGDLRYKTDENKLKKNKNLETIYNKCLDTSRYFEFLNGKSGNRSNTVEGTKHRKNRKNNGFEKERVKKFIKNRKTIDESVEKTVEEIFVPENTLEENFVPENTLESIEESEEQNIESGKILIDGGKKVKTVKRRIFILEKIQCKKCMEDEYMKKFFNL